METELMSNLWNDLLKRWFDRAEYRASCAVQEAAQDSETWHKGWGPSQVEDAITDALRDELHCQSLVCKPTEAVLDGIGAWEYQRARAKKAEARTQLVEKAASTLYESACDLFIGAMDDEFKGHRIILTKQLLLDLAKACRKYREIVPTIRQTPKAAKGKP